MIELLSPRVSEEFMQTEMAAELYCDEVLTGDGHLIRLNIPSSVSGLIRFDSDLDHAQSMHSDPNEREVLHAS